MLCPKRIFLNELGIFFARLELKFSALKQLHEKWHTP